MKKNIEYLHKLPDSNNYQHLLENLEKGKQSLNDHMKKYTDKQEYDKIVDLYQMNKQLVDNFKQLVHNDELVMLDVITAIRKNQESFNKNQNVKMISNALGLESSIKVTSTLRSINEIYAKAQENSNIIIIYDIEKKKIFQLKCDRTFPLKCFSLFADNTIYLCGGLANRQSINNLTKIKVFINYDQFNFEFTDLAPMLNGRYSHGMLFHKDYMIAISGNTKTNEIYDMKQNVWHKLPDLPTKSLNPSLVVAHDQLYCFSGSVNSTSLDRIYKLSLLNIGKILQEPGFEDIMNWESIDYYYHNNNGRLRRGMAALCVGGNSIFLFGGFDSDNIYDNIYDFALHKKDESDEMVVTQIGLELPIKTFFNSNIVLYDMYLIMIDGFNNALELDLKTQEFFYYT
jgi:hypothetical protein